MQGRRARAQRCGQEWLVRSDWYGTGGAQVVRLDRQQGPVGPGGAVGAELTLRLHCRPPDCSSFAF